ncbi:MAG: fumarate reductase/succinate dehydrogenase flavoprotein subunit [Akkermansia sp.]|nr:fumarate reductase/succinate dehydrogenase flavoprotein subunit [Akkermansia sp.]
MKEIKFPVSDYMPDSCIPDGPIAEKWTKYKREAKLINPNNRRKYTVLIVGTGLAGGSAAATLAELGYNVKCFCYQDSPRRAHSIAAQGGVNAAHNYQNDGDSVYRLFYDTVKGGDFRAREANVYRLAEVSCNIINQCVAQGVPFGREYGGLLDNRSFGGSQLKRTFYSRGQTGQQLLLGCYQAMEKEIGKGHIEMYPRTEMMDLVVVDGHAKGIVVRDMVTGEIKSYAGDTVLLATGGYGRVFFLSTNAMGCNVGAACACWKKGAYFANPCFTQIHPTCIPVKGDYQSKLTLMSESLRNDGRIWVPKSREVAAKIRRGEMKPSDVAENDRDYYLERKYPSFGNLAPRDISSRAAKEACDDERGVANTGRGVFLDFKDAIDRMGKEWIDGQYGNLFEMYEEITDVDPHEQPMMIYPASHYTMGGLWVDYNLMSSIPGLHVLGEANFSDHGANRLGASALMQGLSDGYFVIPATLPTYLTTQKPGSVTTAAPEFIEAEEGVKARIQKMMDVKGTKTPDEIHRELGKLVWEDVGMGRTKESLMDAIEKIPAIRDDFWNNVKVVGSTEGMNQELEKAWRVAAFLDFAEVLCYDALNREESCGAHFRLEHQLADGEAKRDDANFAYVACWEYKGTGELPVLHKEPLTFDTVHLAIRSYK